MAVSPNTDFTAGQILTATQQNNFPRGVMGYFISTANHAVTTTLADVTGASLTFTAVANRLYKATFSYYIQQSDAAAQLTIQLTDTTPTVQNYRVQTNSNNNGMNAASHTFLFTSTAGSITRKIRAQLNAGTGTIFGATADTRFYNFFIEDMGPA